MINYSDYDEIKGGAVLVKLHAGESVINKEGVTYFLNREENYKLWAAYKDVTVQVDYQFNELMSNTWYVRKPFNTRKEMLKKPNEWVAKFITHGKWYYVGFDYDEMVAIQSDNIRNKVDYNDDNSDITHVYGIENAVPLDEADLKILVELKNKK